jgi:glycosyltransferase involved in cell wall biosynthesis
MRIAMVVPGGVDRSGEFRVIPTLLSLIERLARDNDVRVFALYQEDLPAEWDLLGARVINVGRRHTRRRALHSLITSHRVSPFDVVHAIWSGTCGLVAVTAAKLIRRPCLVHVAGGELAAVRDIGYGGMLTWRGRLRETWVLRNATAVTAASRPIIESLERLGISAHRVPLGVDRCTWPARAPMRRSPGRPVRLIHVASLNSVKDQRMLLHALAALVASPAVVEMDVVGEDTLNGEIQSLAARLNLSRHIRFHGFVSHRNLQPFIEAADILVMTSRHETGPLVMLEAAVKGVPTVGTAVGHIVEWSPEAAVAVPIGDSMRLAHEIGRLIDDEALRLALAGAAQERALHEDADYTARSFLGLYAILASTSPATKVNVCR